MSDIKPQKGNIVGARMFKQSIMGHVFSHPDFKDNTPIQTSQVEKLELQEDGTYLAETRNSLYTVSF